LVQQEASASPAITSRLSIGKNIDGIVPPTHSLALLLHGTLSITAAHLYTRAQIHGTKTQIPTLEQLITY